MSMRTFWEMVEDVIEKSDVVLEVVDARMPELTRNDRIETMVSESGKSMIIVLNKIDLVPKDIVKAYHKRYVKEYPCVSVSTRERQGISMLKRKIFEIGKKRSRQQLKIGVVGYPNTGKSSVINALAGKSKTTTSATPGQTKHMQWVTIGPGVKMMDTPGVIPLTEEDSELKQTLIGSMDPSKVKDAELAAKEIVHIFLTVNKGMLERIYDIEIKDDGFEDIVEKIGVSKKMVKKGGVVDKNRVYITMIKDWQRGKLLLREKD